MPTRDPLLDVTGTVPLDDARAVAQAVAAVLAPNVPGLPRAFLEAAFDDVARLYAGGDGAWLACDMPYHDLRHALDTALATARMIDGHARAGGAWTAQRALATVLLALVHDTGFLRRRDEAGRAGPTLADVHEARSVAFASAWLPQTPLATEAGLAPMLLCTRVAQPTAPLFAGRDAAAATVGCLLGTADLVCQLADPRYPERCYHHLYTEFAIGGVSGPFRDARDLVAKTPGFHAAVLAPRLAGDLRDHQRFLATHFGGDDPYARQVRTNIARCERIARDGRWDELATAPPTTTAPLDARYCAAR